MHAAIVKFDSLADAVWSAAEDHDLAPLGRPDLIVAAIEGGIVIRGEGLELGGAGVDQPEGGDQSQLLAAGADGVLGLPGEVGDLTVRKTVGFGFGE